MSPKCVTTVFLDSAKPSFSLFSSWLWCAIGHRTILVRYDGADVGAFDFEGVQGVGKGEFEVIKTIGPEDEISLFASLRISTHLDGVLASLDEC